MKQRFWQPIYIFFTLSILLNGCRDKSISTESVEPISKRAETYTIVFGGDFILGRRLNIVSQQKQYLENMFHDALPVLKNADLSVVNAEGVISQRGIQVNKHMAAPIYYHVHPDVLHGLTTAGIDVVTVGNNHAGDYGEAAFIDMLYNLESANIDYFGGGFNAQDARQPAYHRLGNIVVALAGGELSGNRHFLATANSPGILLFNGLYNGSSIDYIVNQYTEILNSAKQFAHLVFFSPHWGANYQSAPTRNMQELAHRLIDAGYDGIFGHSAHQAHGIEMYNGKPIVYDMGNVLLDTSNQPSDKYSFLCEVKVSQAGAEYLHIVPLDLKENNTFLASGTDQNNAIKEIVKMSRDFGTTLVADATGAHLTLQPGLIKPPVKKNLPQRVKLLKPLKSRGILLDKLPEGTKLLNIHYSNGVTLSGYRILSNKIFPGDGVVIDLFFKTEKQINAGVNVHIEARGILADTKVFGTLYAGHIPGDWVFPMTEWPTGKYIQDRTCMTLNFNPEGDVMIYAGLWNGKKMLDNKLIRLEKVTFKQRAPLMGTFLEKTP
ncbi:MAG: CapA family protein [Deltaproteobacteria bacterium]|nr:CapA family protein [Deltaproteobacteria bacterium]